jgi:hypothetical protein
VHKQVKLSELSGNIYFTIHENRVLSRVFGPQEDVATEAREKCAMRSFIIYTLHQILLGCSSQGGWNGWGM